MTGRALPLHAVLLVGLFGCEGPGPASPRTTSESPRTPAPVGSVLAVDGSTAAVHYPDDDGYVADPPLTSEVLPKRTRLSERPNQLSVSRELRCLLLAEGKVSCWGHLDSGNANGVPRGPLVASELPKVHGWTQLHVNPHGVCGLHENGDVECVGLEGRSRSPLDGIHGVVQLGESCARKNDGKLVCVDVRGTKPVVLADVEGAKGFVELPVYRGQGACAVSASGARCGPLDSEHSTASFPEADEVVVSERVSCAHQKDGKVICSRNRKESEPFEVAALAGTHSLSVFKHQLCGIDAEGVLCAYLGDPEFDKPFKWPAEGRRVAGTRGARQIRLGLYSGAALLDDGKVVTFPLNPDVEARNALEPDRECLVQSRDVLPIRVCHGVADPRFLGLEKSLRASAVAGLESTVELAGGGEAPFCGRRIDGQVVCFSADAAAVTTSERTRWDGVATIEPPSPVVGVHSARDIAVAGNHACALLEDGSVDCWGMGDHGELGDGRLRQESRPHRVPGLAGVQAIGATRTSTLVLVDGALRCFGACNERAYEWFARPLPYPAPLAKEGSTPSPINNFRAFETFLYVWRRDGSFGGLGGGNLQDFSAAKISEVTFPQGAIGIGEDGQLYDFPWSEPYQKSSDPLRPMEGMKLQKLLGPNLAIKEGRLVRYRFGSKMPYKLETTTDVANAAGKSEVVQASRDCLVRKNGELACVEAAQSPAHPRDADAAPKYANVEIAGGALKVADGDAYHCALRVDGAVVCWGSTKFGELGDGISSTSAEPSFVRGLP